jgi:hypothetical protein
MTSRQVVLLYFGVHLTVICETVHYRWGPLTPREKVPSLIDETGFFYSVEHISEFLTQAKKSFVKADDVRTGCIITMTRPGARKNSC